MNHEPKLDQDATDESAAISAVSLSEAELLENSIIAKALEGLFAAGYRVSVDNGEDFSITDSDDVEAVVSSLRATDSDYLVALRPGQEATPGVLLVYGNDPYEVIADYSLSIQAQIADAIALAEQIEAQN